MRNSTASDCSRSDEKYCCCTVLVRVLARGDASVQILITDRSAAFAPFNGPGQRRAVHAGLPPKLIAHRAHIGNYWQIRDLARKYEAVAEFWKRI